MKLLTLLHRWAGGVIGLFLMILGFSGSVLVLEDSWIGVPHAGDQLVRDPAKIAEGIAAAVKANHGLSRVTFASEDIGVHQAIYLDGGGAYINQSGSIVERWSSMWERPELWIFDLHHHLFMGKAGETLSGILGITGLFFVISGIILWWRTRRTFRLRIWPARMSRSAIIRHHRDVGILVAPLLFLVMATGALMIFDSISKLLLTPFSSETAAPAIPLAARSGLVEQPDWNRMFNEAHKRFPDAEFRRLQFPRQPDAPFLLRMKQASEWTPNGRTYLYFDERGRILGIDDPDTRDVVQSIEEKYYPIHAAKVGGGIWQALVFLTGVALTLLGSLTTYTFWFRRS